MAKLERSNDQLPGGRPEAIMNNESPRRPRLLVITSTFPRWENDPEPGFVFELTRRLADHFEITVLCPHAPGAQPSEVNNGIQIIRYRYAPAPLESLVNNGGMIENLRRDKWKLLLLPGFVVSQALWIWRLAKDGHIDAIHAHWIIPQGLIAAVASMTSRHRRIPMLITSHGADLFALRSSPFRWLKRWTLKHATTIAVVSPAMKPLAAELGVAADRLHVEPMGADLTNLFTPDQSARRSTDEILFVGRLVEKKGLRHLIQALPLVIAENPNAFLTVAGFGPELQHCRELAQQLKIEDRVQFIGPVPHPSLPALYRRAAVLAAPFIAAPGGDQDGLGLILIEALGCDCPVVVSDIHATRALSELSPLIKVAAWQSPQELARLIVHGMSNSHNVKHQTPALRAFDWHERAHSYRNLINAAIESSK